MSELTQCDVGSDCRHGFGIGDANAQVWDRTVIHHLQDSGLCAGQDENGVTDEISVCVPTDGACTWQHYHVANTGGGKVVWFLPQASCEFDGTRWPCGSARPSWMSASGCKSTPVPVPTPTPTPEPTPTPTPTPGSCPLAAPAHSPYVAELRIERHAGTPQQWDATAYIKGPSSEMPPPNWTGSCRTQQCDMNHEKDTQNGIICTIQHCGDHVNYDLIDEAGRPVLDTVGFINWQEGYTVKLTMHSPAILVGVCATSGVGARINVP